MQLHLQQLSSGQHHVPCCCSSLQAHVPCYIYAALVTTAAAEQTCTVTCTDTTQLLLCLQVTNDTASEAVDTRRRLLVKQVSSYKEGSIDISACVL